MRTALVTGGAGFIGSALVRRLIASGEWRVVNLDALTYAGDLATLAAVANDSRYAFVHADVCDAGAVRAALQTHRPAVVMHLAAESHVDRSIAGPSAFVRTNVLGTFTLLEECVRYRDSLDAEDAAAFRFLQVSTDEVFGALGEHGAFDEESPYRPNSPYSATKAAADHLVRAWGRTYGLPVLTSNCSNNYGPFQLPEKLIPLTIRNALAGQPLPVYGRGQNVRDWLYVGDHVDALVAIVERGRALESYVVGGGTEQRNIDVVRTVCALLDELAPDPAGPYARRIEFVADRAGHDWRYAVDGSKLERELGWTPRETFESGLRRTVAWYVEHAEWTERAAARSRQPSAVA